MFTRLALSLVLTVLWLSPSNLQAQSEALKDAYKQGQDLYAEGRYEEAVPLFRTAFVLGVEEFGPDHPATATLANNLAALYKAQGRYEAAERLYKLALAIRKRTLGAEHPQVATSLISLARIYDAQSRYFEAEPLYELATLIQTKTRETGQFEFAE